MGTDSHIDLALFQENERLSPKLDERKFAQIGPFELELGTRLDDVTIAYETWGSLNEAKSNAVLVCHALSGDSHAVGWWDRIVGPGKAIDTETFFVIGSNCLGGCSGSTGPASIGPDGTAYRTKFPAITIRDMVDAQAKLLDQLGIEQILMACGGSMGGMQALEWTVRHPSRVRSAWLTASCAAHNAMQIGFNEAARQAIMRDPNWRGGNYDASDPPANGLAVARMIGHVSFLSEESFERKFSRRIQSGGDLQHGLGPEFEIESYLNHQGDKFTKRFDANSLLYLTKAIDWYDCRDLSNSEAAYLLTSFSSDWLYRSSQSDAVVQLAHLAGLRARHEIIDLPFGHDSFLLDGVHQAGFVQQFTAELREGQ